MADWEYVRIMNRNYLQIKSRGGQESFQYRMLMEEPISGLLPCKLRNVNGISYLLYDVSSLQSVNSLWVERKMNFEAICKLFFSLKRTIKNMEAYLLEAGNLFLYPELLFQEPDTGEVRFLYYPFLEEQEEGRKSFWNFLLSVVNHEDEELTEAVYQFYESMEMARDISWIEAFCRKLEEMEAHHQESAQGMAEEAQQEDMFWEAMSHEAANDSVKGKPKIVEYGKTFSFCILYALIMGGLVYYVYTNYELSSVEWAFFGGALVTVTMGIAVCLYRKYKVVAEGLQSTQGKETILYSDFSESNAPAGDDDITQYGKTVYFEAQEIENKLYGMGKYNRQIIAINKFPFTVGKKEGVVDGVIPEESVSRIHARFMKEEDVLHLEDLNSTNGTYKNGILLTPHERVEVFPEDEIRFGKLSFLYR